MVTNTQHVHTWLHLHHVLTCTHTHHVQIFIAMSDTNSLFTKTTFKTMATAIGRHLNGVTIIVHL
jgi:hypothetical protein